MLTNGEPEPVRPARLFKPIQLASRKVFKEFFEAASRYHDVMGAEREPNLLVAALRKKKLAPWQNKCFLQENYF
ncbi:MAG: hypothetical protein QUT30_11075 [Acidobacteriota bacterium]|nr:hypothetical protein [Acidobacteriota bacterium]